jgi:hypothetical protein
VTRIITIGLIFIFVFIFEIHDTHSKEPELTIEIPEGLLTPPWLDSGLISGRFVSTSSPHNFNFEPNRTFTFKLSKTGGFKDGAYEGSSCSLTNTRTGKVIRRNFVLLRCEIGREKITGIE